MQSKKSTLDELLPSSHESSKMKRGRRPTGSRSGRDALLAVAIQEFATNGVDGVNLRHIAAMANVNVALINHLFKSKAGLWTAAVDHLFESQREHLESQMARLQSDSPLQARLDEFVSFLVTYSRSYSYFPLLLLRESLLPGPRLEKLVQTFVRPLYEGCRPLLLEAIDAGIVTLREPSALFHFLTNTTLMQVPSSNLLRSLNSSHEPMSEIEFRAAVCRMFFNEATE